MTLSKDQKKLRKWVVQWKETGKLLDDIRLAEFRRSNLAETFLSLSDAAKAAVIAYPPTPTSGLVEMQRLFAKMRKK